MKLPKYLGLIGSLVFLLLVILLMEEQTRKKFSPGAVDSNPISPRESSDNLQVATKEWAGSTITEKLRTNSVNAEIIWRIDEPNVKTDLTVYTFIRFEKGDIVSINAGGCVQTGGMGDTWKRYLNPINSDWSPCDKYYGQLNFPGTTTGLTSIAKLNSTNLNILKDCVLEVGYVDDNYRDNGYWGHDDGNCDQCKGVGDAWIELTVSRSVNHL